MKHVIGNTPHCITCKYFVENNETDKNECDGWCTNGLYINGKKINERAKTYKHSGCRNWIEIETGITHFEATTRIPENYRTDAEKVYISTLLKRGDDDEKTTGN